MEKWKELNQVIPKSREWIKDKYSFIKIWKIVLSKKERENRGIKLYCLSYRVGLNGNLHKEYFDKYKEAENKALNLIKFI